MDQSLHVHEQTEIDRAKHFGSTNLSPGEPFSFCPKQREHAAAEEKAKVEAAREKQEQTKAAADKARRAQEAETAKKKDAEADAAAKKRAEVELEVGMCE